MTTAQHGADVAEHPIGERGELMVRVGSGRMAVTGVDGDTVTVRDLDGRDLDDRFVLERGDGRMSVRPRERGGLDLGLGRRGRGGARLGVEVPRHATVSLDTASGEMLVRGLDGEQRLRTASGTITATDVSGQISIDAVSGTVKITPSGAVDLSGRLVSGDLEVRGGSLRTVAVASTSGDITLHSPLDGPGPFSIQTVSGDAQVTVAGGLRVEARTLTGDIASELEHRSESGAGRRDLVIGNAARTLSFRSISGDLRVAAHGAPLASEAPPRDVTSPRDVTPPEPPAPPAPPSPSPSTVAGDPGQAGDPRLAVLRDLEAGTIDVPTATERLAALEDGSDA